MEGWRFDEGYKFAENGLGHPPGWCSLCSLCAAAGCRCIAPPVLHSPDPFHATRPPPLQQPSSVNPPCLPQPLLPPQGKSIDIPAAVELKNARYHEVADDTKLVKPVVEILQAALARGEWVGLGVMGRAVRCWRGRHPTSSRLDHKACRCTTSVAPCSCFPSPVVFSGDGLAADPGANT